MKWELTNTGVLRALYKCNLLEPELYFSAKLICDIELGWSDPGQLNRIDEFLFGYENQGYVESAIVTAARFSESRDGTNTRTGYRIVHNRMSEVNKMTEGEKDE
jgi:hypothetical protein